MNIAANRVLGIFALPLLFFVDARLAHAQGRSKVAQEAADYVLQRFGREAAREGAVTLARKIEVYTARHGDEFLKAVRQVGPRTFHLVEEAGTHGNQAVRALARHGEHGATWVVSRPKGMQLFLKHGDEAAAVLVKHKGIAEPILEKLGQPAVRALQATNTQSCRRLSMMLENGELARIGRSQEVLDVIGSYGDRAMNFVWEHKGALATTAGLTVFLANPEAVLNGTVRLTQVVAENTIKPAVTEIARGTNWTLIILVVGTVGLGCFAARFLHLGHWIRSRLSLPRDSVESAQIKNGIVVQTSPECRRKPKAYRSVH